MDVTLNDFIYYLCIYFPHFKDYILACGKQVHFSLSSFGWENWYKKRYFGWQLVNDRFFNLFLVRCNLSIDNNFGHNYNTTVIFYRRAYSVIVWCMYKYILCMCVINNIIYALCVYNEYSIQHVQ